MSGAMPKRKEGWSGLYPIAGWDSQNDWQGMVDCAELPKCLNPPKGYFATANQDLNAFGNVNPINIHQGHYRHKRILSLLEKKEKLTPQDMFATRFFIVLIEEASLTQTFFL